MANKNKTLTGHLFIRDGDTSIYIQTNGSTDMSKGEAHCSPNDEQKPWIGAGIAMARAFGKTPEDLCEDILKAMGHTVEREELPPALRSDRRPGATPKLPIEKAKRPAQRTRRTQEIPTHLEWGIGEKVECLGKIGDPTPLADIDGNRLRVGDVVEVRSRFLNAKLGEVPVCLGKHADTLGGPETVFGPFVMGCSSAETVQTKDGDVIYTDFVLRRIKKWYSCAVGENYRGVRYIRKEYENE